MWLLCGERCCKSAAAALQSGWPVMVSSCGCRACLDPVTLVPLLMALPLDQPLLLLLLPLPPASLMHFLLIHGYFL